VTSSLVTPPLILNVLIAGKTSSKDHVEVTDRELEHSELWNNVFVSGCVLTDGPNVTNKVNCFTYTDASCRHFIITRCVFIALSLVNSYWVIFIRISIPTPRFCFAVTCDLFLLCKFDVSCQHLWLHMLQTDDDSAAVEFLHSLVESPEQASVKSFLCK